MSAIDASHKKNKKNLLRVLSNSQQISMQVSYNFTKLF